MYLLSECEGKLWALIRRLSNKVRELLDCTNGTSAVTGTSSVGGASVGGIGGDGNRLSVPLLRKNAPSATETSICSQEQFHSLKHGESQSQRRIQPQPISSARTPDLHKAQTFDVEHLTWHSELRHVSTKGDFKPRCCGLESNKLLFGLCYQTFISFSTVACRSLLKSMSRKLDALLNMLTDNPQATTTHEANVLPNFSISSYETLEKFNQLLIDKQVALTQYVTTFFILKRIARKSMFVFCLKIAY